MNAVNADTVMDTDITLPAQIAVTQFFLTVARASEMNKEKLSIVK